MKALEFIIKQGTVFENEILNDYIVPVLVSIATSVSKEPEKGFVRIEK